VAAVVAGWALAQRPELLPGLTVEEAAAGRPVLIATIVGVALGAVILIPSLALLFGLVLHGRFDEQAAARSSDRATFAPRRPRLSLMAMAAVAGAVGLPLTLVFDGGPFLAFGVLALLTFVALASVALGAAAAEGDGHHERL
jgi:cytochrome d ubiquinol oxidase subunit II